MSSPNWEITHLLELAQDPANRQAREELYRLIEAELRQISRARRNEQPHVRSYSTTELIHEIWIRLLGKAAVNEPTQWKSRRHFFATSSRVIQNLLVDRYRKLVREARAPHDRPVAGSETTPLEELERAERFLALHDALERLDQSDPGAAEVCRLRCFGKLLPLLLGDEQPGERPSPAGQELTLQETADQLGVPLSTAYSRWKRAVLFLSRELRGFAPEGFSEEVGS